MAEDEKRLIADLLPDDVAEIVVTGVKRRHFLKLMTLVGIVLGLRETLPTDCRNPMAVH